MTTVGTLDHIATGPETLAGRYLRMFWQPVAVSGDLVPGEPKRIAILGQHFTLYRGQTGYPYLIADRCPHRGTQLSLGWVEGECIRCVNHGWKFNAQGQCVDQPAEKGGIGGKVTIFSYPVREYLGLIFVYLGDGDPPSPSRFPELEDEAEGRMAVRTVHVPCNYFQRIENDVDETHIHFVHKAATEASGLTAIPSEIKASETAYGFVRETWRVQDGLDVVTYAHFFMPNAILVKIAPGRGEERWNTLLAWRVPINDETTRSFIVTRFPTQPGKQRRSARSSSAEYTDPRTLTQAILRCEARVQDLDPDYVNAFTVQDTVVLLGQGSVYQRDNERLGKSDVPVILLRRLWRRELTALSKGRPLKKWSRPKKKLELGLEARAQMAAAKRAIQRKS